MIPEEMNTETTTQQESLERAYKELVLDVEQYKQKAQEWEEQALLYKKISRKYEMEAKQLKRKINTLQEGAHINPVGDNPVQINFEQRNEEGIIKKFLAEVVFKEDKS